MTVLSLEDAGYRKLCPRDWERSENLKTTLLDAGYEVVYGEKFLLCKPLEKANEFISYSACLSKDNYSRWNEILDSLRSFYDPGFIPEQDTYIAEPNVDALLKHFSDGPMPDSLHALASLLAFSHCKQLRSVLGRIADKYFEKYPNGRLHFISVSNRLGEMEAVTRILTVLDAFGVEEFTKVYEAGKDPPEILTKIHPSGIEPITENILKTLLSCFFRFIYGRVVGRLGGYIVVQIDPPESIEPPFDRTRWDFNRVRGMFEPETGFDVMKYIRTLRVDGNKYQLIFRRHIFEQPFTADVFEELLRWTIGKINELWTVSLDLCEHTTQEGYVDLLKQKKTLLTLERMLVEINYIVTEMDPFVRKILYFNLHDKIATLLDPAAGFSKRHQIFNRLLKPSHYKKILRPKLEMLPSSFGRSIPELGDLLLQQVMDGCLESVWAKHRVSTKGVFVREPTKRDREDNWITQKMQDHSDGPYTKEDFSANLLHEMRNSLHGYLLRAGAFEKFMLMHSGDIPDTLSDLAIIWFFLILGDVRGLLSGSWKQAS